MKPRISICRYRTACYMILACLIGGSSCKKGVETSPPPAESRPGVGSQAASAEVAGDAEPPVTASEDLQSLRIEIGGVRIHYLIGGPTTGRPVLLLHGAKYEAQTWQEIGTLELLMREGFRVCAVDLPGHGQSSAADVDETSWLIDLLKVLELNKPVVVSPSMSGIYSLPLVIAAPPRTSGFVAVAPVGIPAFKEKLKRIVVPVLAVWGDSDRTVPRAFQDLLADTVPEGSKVTIPNAGHACYLDNREEFHKELLAFLKVLPPQRD